MKKGLVLEGGAMRGLFTAGILDVMMEAKVEPDGLIGVSAGAAFGCNYKSRQPGRAIRYNKRFARDKRFCSWQSWLKTGDLYNADFGYHAIPTIFDVFDNEAFEENPMEFYAVCTDVETGKPIYKKLTEGTQLTYDWIRASASMPLASKVVELEGMKVLDGGVADSIPLEYFESIGYEKNMVILTQPDGYVKEHNKLMPLMRVALRKYPNMIEAMDNRHIMYNKELVYVYQAESTGRALVIRPEESLPIGHISHNPEEMQRVYEIGRKTGMKYIERIKAVHESILARAEKKGLAEIRLHNLRDYTLDKWRRVDDYPYGGSAGMVMQCEPIDRCITALKAERDYDEVIFTSPDGERFDQHMANELSLKGNLIILAGHYKGIDQRIREHLITKEISIGDFVLTGGELVAAMIADAIVRVVPGVIGDEQSALSDCFQDDILAAPIYTRPAEYKGWKVPEILLSGNEAKIREWEFEQAMERTRRLRPDLLKEK